MSTNTGKQIAAPAPIELVTRSVVTPGLKYEEYRQPLRYDFFHSCAYCTIGESEASAIRFCIDHYEPRRARPDLVNDYGNLMYSCDECNIRKGDRFPPPAAREKGLRFFRPDQDVYDDHFRKSGLRVEEKTPTGYYTKETIDLNRQGLRRMRELRERLAACNEQVLGGILALRRFKLDQLPTNIKGQAARAIAGAIVTGNKITESIDALLRANAHSSLIDEDKEQAARAKERRGNLKQVEALYPGGWRAPRGSS